MRSSIVFIAAAVLLSACAPEGYSRSTAAADQFKESLAGRPVTDVDTVALCTRGGRPAVSMLFEGGEFYHYMVDGEKPELVQRSTKAQREKVKKGYYEPDNLGCIGYYTRDAFRPFVETGAYRLEFDFWRIRAYVADEVMYDNAFGDKTKARLAGAALAVSDAVERQKTYVPVEDTWNP
jgi:hypothetical protein